MSKNIKTNNYNFLLIISHVIKAKSPLIGPAKKHGATSNSVLMQNPFKMDGWLSKNGYQKNIAEYQVNPLHKLDNQSSHEHN